jgi:rhamnose utilization protein RhaD (predicted bifunctional aldolase and dehydrogenase)/NAD(P)-dependent dehydrogenase (short-subunit alcohol dehydrogenase family)
MQSKWSDSEAQAFIERYHGRCNQDVALRVYSSRLIGKEPSLVLHGGGNTSVKTVVKDDLGRDTEVLCVKGSGWDLGNIEPEGLPAVRLEPLKALRHLPQLGDEEMVNAQRTRMLDASAPNPSVETLLHAFLPHKFIDHSHADFILSLVDQPDAEKLCRERYGARFAIVPYIMPGFALAKLAAEVYEQNPEVEGMLLLQHGLFTFGQSARESYERHVRAVDEAEELCSRKRYWGTRRRSRPPLPAVDYSRLAPVLRGQLCEGGRRYVLHLRTSSDILEFVDDEKLETLSQQGCATPDHVIRTKRYPMLLRVSSDLDDAALRARIAERLAAYRAEYESYVQRQMAHKGIVVRALDPDPRVILVPGLGLISAGGSPEAAAIAADIYEHTIAVIRNAQAVGEYRALPEADIFDMEYWSLEQAKLGKSKARPLAGRVVYITGAARGIGAATARAFAGEGAVPYLVDREAEPLAAVARELGCAGEALDLCDERAVRRSVQRAIEAHGGVDGVVSNAGIAPQGAIDSASTEQLQQSFAINFYAHHWVASAAIEAFKRQGRGGFLLFNASKAAFNPGAEFGPYAIPKAALVALMKQYALELGRHGIRSNAVNADRIRTGLLDSRDIEARAKARNLEVDDYYRTNLLGREVTAGDVAHAFVSLALAESTTGSVLTVDGGNIAASPR